MSGKVVTVSNASLDGKDVTIRGTGYTLKLANDVTFPTALAPVWTVKNTNATLHTDTSGANTLSIVAQNASVEGDKSNDKLVGSANNNSLNGVSGNDTLYGGDGDDIFIYKPNEGTNKIMDYNSGDMLQILKADGSAGGSLCKMKLFTVTLL